VRPKVRLFVPLATEPFRWFESGKKKWELRKYGKQYTEKNIFSGREVELRRGYNTTDSLWGRLGEVLVVDSLEDLFLKVDFEKIIPVAASHEEAIKRCLEILRPDTVTRYICFEIVSIGEIENDKT
jgi:ASC-1-like (ASCH) protein